MTDTTDPTDTDPTDEYHTTEYADGDEVTAVPLAVSSTGVACEVGYALLGRAQRLHEDPNPDNEQTAKELRDLAWEIINTHEEQASTPERTTEAEQNE